MFRPLHLAAVALALANAPTAFAGVVDFEYSGFFGSRDSLTTAGTTTALADATPFELTATFDDSSENLVESLGLPGFAAFDPLTANMTIGGAAYRVASYGEDGTGGISIAIFDRNNASAPGLYGIGFIVDPVADGAGIVGRFGGATADFTIDALQSTVMTGFIGAGFRSGVGPAGPACFVDPSMCAVTPITLFDQAGAMAGLTIGSRAENVSTTGLAHAASITPVPLPGGLALMVGALGALAGWRRLGRHGRACGAG